MRWPKHAYLRFAIPALLLTAVSVGINTLNRSHSVVVPAGTAIQVRLDQSIATDRSTSGNPFQATVAEPIVIAGKTAIPKGAVAKGRIVYMREAGRLQDVAGMRLALESVEIDGKKYELHTTAFARRGGNHKKRNWEMIGGGAGGGALIGALASGGKGALIGGPVGAGAGVAAAALTGKKDFMLPAETLLNFELIDPVTVELKT